MGNIADKLNYLNNTIEEIKNAITSKGQPVSNEEPLRNCVNKIKSIETYTPSKLEYIEATDPVIFNTGYKHTGNTNIEAKFRQSSVANGTYVGLFGARNGDASKNAFVFFTKYPTGSGSSFKNNFCYCRTRFENIGTAIFDTDVVLSISGKRATYTDGNRTYSITASGNLDNGVNNLFLMDFNSGGANEDKSVRYSFNNVSSDGLRVYYFKIFEGTELVKHYVPYRNEKGQIGFLEILSNTFLPHNAILKTGEEI